MKKFFRAFIFNLGNIGNLGKKCFFITLQCNNNMVLAKVTEFAKVGNKPPEKNFYPYKVGVDAYGF